MLYLAHRGNILFSLRISYIENDPLKIIYWFFPIILG
jgi:hypothetical protein